VVASATTLLLGIARNDAVPIGFSFAAALVALFLLWAAVARSSGPTQRDRHG
jgi:hypothetical protein